MTTEKLLLLAFEAVEEAGVSEEDIDNQHTEEESVSPFTPKEIKALRQSVLLAGLTVQITLYPGSLPAFLFSLLRRAGRCVKIVTPL